jgi:hypothetical protein
MSPMAPICLFLNNLNEWTQRACQFINEKNAQCSIVTKQIFFNRPPDA